MLVLLLCQSREQYYLWLLVSLESYSAPVINSASIIGTFHIIVFKQDSIILILMKLFVAFTSDKTSRIFPIFLRLFWNWNISKILPEKNLTFFGHLNFSFVKLKLYLFFHSTYKMFYGLSAYVSSENCP